MTIETGNRIPNTAINVLKDGIQAIDTSEFFAGRKVVMFAVPGAFTPTCSAKHLPGFIRHAEEFTAKGYALACLSVNDAFVMGAWAKSQETPDSIAMLADGNGAFTKALGLELDATPFGMGLRAKRFALAADNGIVTHLFVEAPGEFSVSSAEHVLSAL
ncbi:peroxiredoxin [Arenimonas sp. GDDSR-1]|uniref:peroxiredoxin n=1 Tax=Arenimonas sp. GDDSR-1 TaxID=2950125 RepID=UPI00262EB433|nr:peroxiredoxin [Arenimonas sp. GDDSR-1]